MRVAIFSDVHGNATALEAVLADMDKQGTFDHIVFAGDLVLGGPYPQQCIALLQERNIIGVHGNTDLIALNPPAVDDEWDEATRQLWDMRFARIDWTHKQIGADGLDYLQSLPFEIRLSPNENCVHDLLIVHANPVDVDQLILPSEAILLEVQGKILQPDSKVLPLLDGVTAYTIAFGHVHVPNVRQIDNYTLANISSVSIPQDDNWHAKWAILEFADNQWQITHRYVEYDVHLARQALYEVNMPYPEPLAEAMLLPN